MVTRKQTYTINHSVDVVKNILTRLDIFGDYHPLILETLQMADGLYRIKEQPFSFLPFRFYYQCKVTVKENEVRYHIKGIPIMNPYMFFKLSATADAQSKLDVYIRVASVPLIKTILLSKMFSAQDSIWAKVNTTSSEELI